jgi:hypothetical protein
MSSPLEQVNELHNLIRDLQKMNSKLLSGQIILAHRDVNRIISDLERRVQAMVNPSNQSFKDIQNNMENN